MENNIEISPDELKELQRQEREQRKQEELKRRQEEREELAEAKRLERELRRAERELEKEKERAKKEAEKEKERAKKNAEKEKERAKKETDQAYERRRKEEYRAAQKMAAEARKEIEREEKARAREEAITDNKIASLGRLGYLFDSAVYDSHGYKFDERGHIAYTLANIENLFTEHPDFEGKFRRNTFKELNEFEGEVVSDDVLTRLYRQVEDYFGVVNKFKVDTAVNNVCNANKVHPILDVVEKLEWDGVRRVERFFIDRLGAPDTPLTREITFKWLMAMLGRVKHPGMVFDCYLIVSDPQQGTGKSKTFERLTDWLGVGYTATNLSTDVGSLNKDNILYINSCVIGLFDETSQIKYANLESFKSFVTNNTLKVRVPYAKTVGDYQVHCVYAATTNDSEFLTDSTSQYERRAWVLVCKGDNERTPEKWNELNNPEVMKQIWAELNYWHDEKNIDKAPWPVRGTRITYLSKENTEALKSVQRGVKTKNSDTETNNAIETILRQKYSRNTADGRSSGPVFKTEKEFSEDQKTHSWNDTALVYPLMKIPFRWFCGYVNRELGKRGNRREEYIRSIIEGGELNDSIGEWRIGYKSYDNLKQKCLYRVLGPEDSETAGTEPEEPKLFDDSKPLDKPKPSEEPKPAEPKKSGRPKYLHEKVYEMTRDENAVPDAEHSPMMEKIRAIQRGETVEPSRETPPAAPARKPKKPLDTNTRNWSVDDVDWEEVQL